jgi:hypothetical protein
LTAPGLAAAIKEVAGSSSIKKAAESLKQGLVDHNGAASCANLLRRILHRPWDRSVMEVQRPRSSPPRALTLLLSVQTGAAQAKRRPVDPRQQHFFQDVGAAPLSHRRSAQLFALTLLCCACARFSET